MPTAEFDHHMMDIALRVARRGAISPGDRKSVV